MKHEKFNFVCEGFFGKKVPNIEIKRKEKRRYCCFCFVCLGGFFPILDFFFSFKRGNIKREHRKKKETGEEKINRRSIFFFFSSHHRYNFKKIF
jgi:hypothetical protein